MDEMTMLTALRDEVPLAPPSPAAERLFRAGITAKEPSERVRLTHPRRRLLPGVFAPGGQLRWWRLAVAGVAAAGLAAGLVTAFLPQDAGTPAEDPAASGTVMSAHLLADIASKQVLKSGTPVKPDQWVYRKFDNAHSISILGNKEPPVLNEWSRADGASAIFGPEADGRYVYASDDKQIRATAAKAYENLGSLPKDPAALERYFAVWAGSRHAKPYQLAMSSVWGLTNLLEREILPPSLTAEIYQALADVPGILAKKDVRDIAGQAGVEFILPPSPDDNNLYQATILNARTYQYLGQASWYGTTAHKKGYGETVLLRQAFVSGPRVMPKG